LPKSSSCARLSLSFFFFPILLPLIFSCPFLLSPSFFLWFLLGYIHYTEGGFMLKILNSLTLYIG
jgi:hypothetical protein